MDGERMRVFIDTREHQRAIRKIQQTFDRRGVIWRSTKLFVGDYQRIDNPLLVIDRKQNLLEVAQNVCLDHDRFIRELNRAREMGIHLVFLVEHSASVRTLDDVRRWVNPRLKVSPLAMSGERLHKVLTTISAKYDTEFRFCSKAETGDRIIQILQEGGCCRDR